MMFKVFTTLSLLFALGIAIILGQQLYGLASQIGQKDRETFIQSTINSATETPIPEAFDTVIINGKKVEVSIADTPQKRTQGLMNVEQMDYNKGMLFLFNREGNYSFWMKDTKIPLDMVWINNDLLIVHIENNVPICEELICPRYSSPETAKYVLETNAGWAKGADARVGMKVSFQ